MVEVIKERRQAIADVRRRNRVKRLELFGSAARSGFRPDSDVDFLVEFLDADWHHAADNWFGLQEGLEALLGHCVELVSTPDISNPYFLQLANLSRTELYAA